MEHYTEDADVLIGDCDCTDAFQAVCEEMGVQGYPSIKFGEPLSGLQDYRDWGARPRKPESTRTD